MEPVAEVRRGDGRHFFEGGEPLHEIPLDRLIGPCFVADLTGVERSIFAGDLKRADIPIGTERLLLKTSNSALWSDPRHPFFTDFVDLSEDGAEWLRSGGIRLVGIDYLSIEGPTNEACPVHRSLLAAEIVILEGLDLRVVESGSYELICLPLKAMNGDGAPARAVLREDRV